MEQTNFVNRRKYPRFDPSVIRSLKSVQLDEDTEIKLINISRRGALVETQKRITPGSRISLKIFTQDTAYSISGKVLRSKINEIDKIVTYRFAIIFDEEFAILPAE